MPRLTNPRRKAYNKDYYENNRTRILTEKKENSANAEKRKDEKVRYRTNSKRILCTKKKRYLLNCEQLKAAKRERYGSHSDEKRASKRERYASHSDGKKAAERERCASHSDEKKAVKREKYASHSEEKKRVERKRYSKCRPEVLFKRRCAYYGSLLSRTATKILHHASR